MAGIGSHTTPNQGATDDWLTPPWILERLGPFDLDPCASEHQPWATARRHLTKSDDGLSSEWKGYVWLNPPYGQETWYWLERLSNHRQGGIALIFARTETAGFFEQVWRRASALLFLEKRLFFHLPVTGERAYHNSGGPSVLVGYGTRARIDLKGSGIIGAFVDRWEA